ncbi:hypothetical protein [Amycolatopsis sp. VC5-11]|uniref:hypothetical protein n=1 Tax=Amycolatopsis sp. VC5-11 TaxID=3120156 RepID=UPI00300A1D1B
MGRRSRQFRPREVGVKLKLPFVGEISGSWTPHQAEAKAARELYVELATRISVVKLRRDEGLAREALSSLYTLFGTTRDILRKYGPEVSPRGRADAITFGKLVLTMLNVGGAPAGGALTPSPRLVGRHPRGRRRADRPRERMGTHRGTARGNRISARRAPAGC